MGRYLNPANKGFMESLRSEIYVDKTDLIKHTNGLLGTKQKYICISRPRRFGKSMALEMLAAYYSSGQDSKDIFEQLKIGNVDDFCVYMNRYDVIVLNMQEFLSNSRCMDEMIIKIQENVIKEIKKKYLYLDKIKNSNLVDIMYQVFEDTNQGFVILIDEWDCIFREYKDRIVEQGMYLDFLRDWLKDKPYVELAYMTGILPIKKYGTHSALNMFTEYSMANPRQFSEFVGFTEEEVKGLCKRYNMNFEETKAWYDGYSFTFVHSIYSPKSVVECMLSRIFDNYWNQTETFEALKIYIQMNFEGLKDKVIEMIAGGRIKINTGSFTNDMTTFHNADDVLTLLIHLGYLAYRFETKEVYIPNKEVTDEFINAVNVIGWNEVITSIKASDDLLLSIWKLDEEAVATGIEQAHESSASILQYNDENALSAVINLAFFAARNYYTIIREFPTGKGFADLVYLPRKKFADKPAMVIELKWNKGTEGAIDQIKNRHYVGALTEYQDNLILAGISYDKSTKVHSCKLEKYKR